MAVRPYASGIGHYRKRHGQDSNVRLRGFEFDRMIVITFLVADTYKSFILLCGLADLFVVGVD
jgi:hypothetical protein